MNSTHYPLQAILIVGREGKEASSASCGSRGTGRLPLVGNFDTLPCQKVGLMLSTSLLVQRYPHRTRSDDTDDHEAP